MTRRSRTILAIAAAVSAMALLALQIIGGLEYTEGQTLYVRASMIAAMVAVAFLPLYIHAAWHVGRVLSVVLFSAFIFLLIYSLPASIGRISEGKEVKAIAASDAQAILTRLSQISATLQTAEPAANAACAKDFKGKPSDMCIHRTAVVKSSLAEQRRLKADLKAIGVSERAGDVSSAQVAWALTWAGIQPEEVRRATGIAFPVGLELAIFSLVWLVAKLSSGPGSPPGGGTQPRLPTPDELQKLRAMFQEPAEKGAPTNAMAGEPDWQQNWTDLGFRPRARTYQDGELVGDNRKKTFSFSLNASNSSSDDQQETAMSPVTEASFDIPTLSSAQIAQLAGKLAGKAIPRQATKAAALRRLESEIDANLSSAKAPQVKKALAVVQHFGGAEEIIDRELSPVSQAVSWGQKSPKKKDAVIPARKQDDFDKVEEAVSVESATEEEKTNGIRGRKSGLLGKKLHPKVAANPRRQNTWGHRSMAIILGSPGLTTEEFVKAGGRLKDLIWDLKYKHVEAK